MRIVNCVLLAGVSGLSLTTMLGGTAAAQSADQPSIAASADATSAEDVIVTGVRASLRNALAIKRSSDLISDVISTKDIGQLPDVTIAEELNRLPGINTTRDRGNASQASVRGLGPRFVFGLVNGREVASSEPSQDVRWEVYPSEVLSGAQVYKTQDAALVPGGIAATIDIRTLTPLDYSGPALSIRGGPTYNESGKSLPHFSPWGYRGSIGYIHHLTDTLAIALGASVQREKNGSTDFRTFSWNTPDTGQPGDLNGDGKPDNTNYGLVTEVKETQQDRQAYVANLGWKPTDALTLNVDSLYSKYTIAEDGLQSWYGNNILGNWSNGNAGVYNAPGNTYDIVNNSVVAATLLNSFPNYQSEIARYKETHQLIVAGLNAKWEKDGWTAIVDLSHSQAKRRNNWRAIYLETKYATSLTYDIRDGQTPSATLTGNGFDDLSTQAATPSTDPSFNGRDGQSAGPETTHDRISAATASLKHDLNGGFFKSVEFGGRLSDRLKRHKDYQYNLCAGSTTSGICDASAHSVSLANTGLELFDAKGFTAPPVIYGDFSKIFPLVYPDASVPAGSEQLLQHTSVGEKTAEGYGKLAFESSGSLPINGSIGIRVEHVRTHSSGYQQDGSGVISPISVTNSYTEYLPSLNLTAHLTENQQLRVGASIGISRPPLEALVTGFVLNPIVAGQPNTGGGGNPFLKPYKAKQIDLSYENYFAPEALFAVALYYKHLDTFIGASSATQNINGTSYIISGVNNGKGGDLGGAEITFQSRLSFLPGPLSNLGIYTNYARVESNVHEFAPASDPYPMVGVAKNTAEFDTYYNQGGFEARVAFKYHSPFTVAPTWVGTVLKRLAAEKTIDASVSYQLTKAIGLRFQARNLTNERARFTSDNNVQDLANDGGYQLYGRSYLADISVRF
ncbi:MAG TPA: TonB-dependent receptor [Sphingomonas sp.]|uniref:TonB-dependent receptor n=1 Tax=Sphingomonas sp. TaxID=28214 RepID=UPI002C8CF403|nr:TonB-dependent receptor [Sphingomonas sp.]HMI19944.1 TonB-dependent receptor [Sphingomonas sp.]